SFLAIKNPPLTDSEEDYLIAISGLEGGEGLTLTPLAPERFPDWRLFLFRRRRRWQTRKTG
ncbi:hypothetical protein ACFPPD_18280, partial [Cohnella suwonensis]